MRESQLKWHDRRVGISVILGVLAAISYPLHAAPCPDGCVSACQAQVPPASCINSTVNRDQTITCACDNGEFLQIANDDPRKTPVAAGNKKDVKAPPKATKGKQRDLKPDNSNT